MFDLLAGLAEKIVTIPLAIVDDVVHTVSTGEILPAATITEVVETGALGVAVVSETAKTVTGN